MPKNKKPSFMRRLSSVLIDYCIILAYMGLLGVVVGILYLLTGRLPDWLGYGVAPAEALGFIVLVLPVGLYLYLSEISSRHATIGKKVLHLTVVSDTSNRMPSKGQIAVRTIVKLLPWELAHFFVWHTVAATSKGQPNFPLLLEIGLVGCIALPISYVLVVALQPRGKGPHDLIAGTRVVTAATAMD